MNKYMYIPKILLSCLFGNIGVTKLENESGGFISCCSEKLISKYVCKFYRHVYMKMFQNTTELFQNDSELKT